VPDQLPVFVAMHVGHETVELDDHTIGDTAVIEAFVKPPKLLVEVVM
jgi:hypothetical protein